MLAVCCQMLTVIMAAWRASLTQAIRGRHAVTAEQQGVYSVSTCLPSLLFRFDCLE